MNANKTETRYPDKLHNILEWNVIFSGRFI